MPKFVQSFRLPRWRARLGTAGRASWRSFAPLLQCFVRPCRKGAWTKAVVGDLVALQAVHPAGDVDAWIKLAVENKSSWKQLVKPFLTHIGSPAMGPAEMVQCPDCHKSFLVKELGAHPVLATILRGLSYAEWVCKA